MVNADGPGDREDATEINAPLIVSSFIGEAESHRYVR